MLSARALVVPLLLLAGYHPAAAAEPPLPDQVLILRAPATTRLELDHRTGDRAFRLTAKNPPPGMRATLAEQRGPYVTGVEHLRRQGDETSLLVRLSTAAVTLKLRRLRRPTAFAIELIPLPRPPSPPLSELVGRVAGIVQAPPWPILLPVAPVEHPCTGNRDASAALRRHAHFTSTAELDRWLDLVTEPMCRTYCVAELAAGALAQGANLSPFERWAYTFSGQTRKWPLYPEAYAQVSLVAAEILTRLEYHPEARAILADASRYRETDAVARAMALANHFAARGERSEAETLYAQLVAEGFDPWIIYQASLGRAMNALAGDDLLGALSHVEMAQRRLGAVTDFPGTLWTVGGEAALARGEASLARRAFERLARARDPEDRALGLLRLADLEARSGRTKSALKGWEMARVAGRHCIDDHVHLRRVLALEENPGEVSRFLKSQAEFSRCPAVRLEAEFAQAVTALERGDHAGALDAAFAAERAEGWDFAVVRPAAELLDRVAREALARLERERDPAGLVLLFEARLEPRVLGFDPRTRLRIAEAYHQVGASMRGAEELIRLLTDHPGLPFREEATVRLGEALLAANDSFRTDLVLRHLDGRFPAGRERVERRWLWGRYEAAMKRPQRALSHLVAARQGSGAGDRAAEIALDEAKVLLSLGRPLEAANALTAAAEAETLPPEALLAPVITSLSELARSGPTGPLPGLAKALVPRVGEDQISGRLASALARRRAWPGADSEDPSRQLYGRLEALGVGGDTP